MECLTAQSLDAMATNQLVIRGLKTIGAQRGPGGFRNALSIHMMCHGGQPDQLHHVRYRDPWEASVPNVPSDTLWHTSYSDPAELEEFISTARNYSPGWLRTTQCVFLVQATTMGQLRVVPNHNIGFLLAISRMEALLRVLYPLSGNIFAPKIRGFLREMLGVHTEAAKKISEQRGASLRLDESTTPGELFLLEE